MTEDMTNLRSLTTQIVAAFVGHNQVPMESIPEIIQKVYSSLQGMGQPVAPVEAPIEPLKPAVPVRKSIQADYLICLEDGKKLKMLKRHLMSNYGMTPADYRTKWGLPSDYPMVAPNYAAARSKMAREIGLGRRPGRDETGPEDEPA